MDQAQTLRQIEYLLATNLMASDEFGSRPFEQDPQGALYGRLAVHDQRLRRCHQNGARHK